MNPRGSTCAEVTIKPSYLFDLDIYVRLTPSWLE